MKQPDLSWRKIIGRGGVKRKRSRQKGTSDNCNVSELGENLEACASKVICWATLAVFVLAVLLMRGNVEINPGPSERYVKQSGITEYLEQGKDSGATGTRPVKRGRSNSENNEQMLWLLEKFEELLAPLHVKLDRIDKRFTEIEMAVKEQKEEFTKLENKFKETETAVEIMKKEMSRGYREMNKMAVIAENLLTGDDFKGADCAERARRKIRDVLKIEIDIVECVNLRPIVRNNRNGNQMKSLAKLKLGSENEVRRVLDMARKLRPRDIYFKPDIHRFQRIWQDERRRMQRDRQEDQMNNEREMEASEF